MVIFPLAPDQTIAQMWSSGAQGGGHHTHTIYICDSDLGGFHAEHLVLVETSGWVTPLEECPLVLKEKYIEQW